MNSINGITGEKKNWLVTKLREEALIGNRTFILIGPGILTGLGHGLTGILVGTPYGIITATIRMCGNLIGTGRVGILAGTLTGIGLGGIITVIIHITVIIILTITDIIMAAQIITEVRQLSARTSFKDQKGQLIQL
jgi:hypothetical protein